jgi:ATP-dependent Clp protease, protease subunit
MRELLKRVAGLFRGQPPSAESDEQERHAAASRSAGSAGPWRTPLFERLLRDRIVVLFTPIDDDVATVVIAQLLFLESEDKDQDVSLYINSPGGSVTAALAILDTMKGLRPKVATTCLGQAGGVAAFLLASGASGKRFATGPSLVQLTGLTGPEGMDVQALEAKLNEALAAATRDAVSGPLFAPAGQDIVLTALEAQARGIIDEIVPAPTWLR